MFALRVRSHFSLYYGTASPKELCSRAKALGYHGIALTDRNNLYGLPEFLKESKAAGLIPIIGAEITEHQSERTVTCLVQSQKGFANLCRLITRRQTEKEFALTSIPDEFAEGLLFLCQDLSSLHHFHTNHFSVLADLGWRPDANAIKLKKVADQLAITSICTANSGILSAADQRLHHLLKVIENKATLSSLQCPPANPLHPPEQYKSNFAIWPEVIDNTIQRGNSITYHGPSCNLIMPPYKEPGNVDLMLREKAYKGAVLRYGDDLSEAVVERLEYELKIIREMNFSSYFLVVRDIVHRKDKDGIRRKRRICGRGSGAASLVAYCLEITNICPVKNNLYFERFLNPGRSDPPDIDIDFAWDERDEVLKEILTDYTSHAAMVCNHVYFKPRMAIRETAKAYGLPAYEISQLTKRLPYHYTPGKHTLLDTIRHTSSLKDQDLAPPWPEILELAQQLIGCPRYLSVHPGGVVITPSAIDSCVPLEKAPKGVSIIQWEKDGAEDMGLVKIDILGNRSLGVIRDCLVNVRANGINFDEQLWEPEEDPATCENVALGKTMGCFYIESPAMRLLQKKAGTGDFEQLVLQSSIIRPAANDFVREYVRRLRGGQWQHLHERLTDVLDETFGLMVYQEDVSKVAVSLAGFSHARADGLRKVLSKKDREVRLKDYREEFYDGCKNNKITDKVIDQLWQMMMSFDGYSFCKPHSASYARVSFQAAYCKTHFPAEFMAAVISNQGGFYSTFAYVSEAKRMGIEILPPDINRSHFRWKGSKQQIRPGFLSIRSLSLRCISKLLSERDRQAFSSFYDFLHRVRPAEDEAKALIHAGAADSFPDNSSRTTLLWQLALFKEEQNSKNAASLFAPKPVNAPALPDQPFMLRCRFEYKTLGFLCSRHPITFFAERTASMVKGADLGKHIHRRITFAGWLLTGKIVSTKTGDAMEFLTFEDDTATVEATFFPKVYHRYSHQLTSGKPYILEGLVEEDFGALTLTVDRVFPLTPAAAQGTKCS